MNPSTSSGPSAVQFDLSPVQAPETTGLAELLAALADGQWHFARELIPALGLKDDRELRLLVAAADGEIVGSNKGVALTRAVAPSGEAVTAAQRMIADGKKLIKRGIRTQRIAAEEVIARAFPVATH